jgi:hypothetical protein
VVSGALRPELSDGRTGSPVRQPRAGGRHRFADCSWAVGGTRSPRYWIRTAGRSPTVNGRDGKRTAVPRPCPLPDADARTERWEETT